MAGSDWFDGNGGGGSVDAHELLEDASTIKAIAEMVTAGALISLGTTSDGGALAVTCTVDGRWRREYHRTLEELHAWLAEAVPAVTEAATSSRSGSGRQSASAGRAERPRRR